MLGMSTQDAILVGATLATVGWMYNARKVRTLARKQHTINIMIKGNFDELMRKSHTKISKYIQNQEPWPDRKSQEYTDLLPSLRYILNHYEFISAGIRRGDLDENLVIDAERGTILSAFESAQGHIFEVRNSRRNQAIYEHLEWIHKRWEQKPPNKIMRLCEGAKGSPFAGKKTDVV